MKTIGLLGGMSWESTVSYYRALNEGVKAALGGLHSAKLCLYSVNFADIERLQHEGNWQATAEILCAAARAVEAGGADFLLICTNTMHKVAPEIEASISIPLLHIADATAQRLAADGAGRPARHPLHHGAGLLQGQNRRRLRTSSCPTRRNLVHRVIHSELCLGQVHDASRQHYLEIIASLHARGAEAVILGCTEIALLVQQAHTPVPLYDTTAIHAEEAVRLAV